MEGHEPLRGRGRGEKIGLDGLSPFSSWLVMLWGRTLHFMSNKVQRLKKPDFKK